MPLTFQSLLDRFRAGSPPVPRRHRRRSTSNLSALDGPLHIETWLMSQFDDLVVWDPPPAYPSSPSHGRPPAYSVSSGTNRVGRPPSPTWRQLFGEADDDSDGDKQNGPPRQRMPPCRCSYCENPDESYDSPWWSSVPDFEVYSDDGYASDWSSEEELRPVRRGFRVRVGKILRLVRRS